MFNKIFRIIASIFAIIFLMGISIYDFSATEKSDAENAAAWKKLSKSGMASNIDTPGVTPVFKEAPVNINSLPLRDNPNIYQYDDPDSVVTMYVTVWQGTSSDNTNHTWKEVNDSTKFFFENMEQVEVNKADALIQVGDENGPTPGELGYGDILPNSIISIRGNTASMAPQKSYKIELFDQAGEWRGQKTIVLNKHFDDITRVRNKLCFDLMKSIPNMVSLRTQFVHLYVRDQTIVPPETLFKDYGLFTQIEQPNKKFLTNHLLDRYGQLYKAIMFEFYRYPDQIRLADDPLYSEEEFSKVLEIKGNKDHSKLIQMLDDVNNWAIPIEHTFAKYFDADNYFTWMAFNILIGNVDTDAQNFFLYSPQNSEKWYFLPWDYDGALMRQDREINNDYPLSQREQGISDYWNGILHRRVLMVPKYREMLDQKIKEMYDFLTPERLNDTLNVYRPVVEPYVAKMPDILYLNGTIETYDYANSLIPDEPVINYELYKESIKYPMPFYLGSPEDLGATYRFNWDAAYDFNAQDINYHLEVATDWDFKDIVREATSINLAWVDVPYLQPGTYYWRVMATNENEKEQLPFDYFLDSEDYPHYGMKHLYVSAEGKIVEDKSGEVK